MSPSPSLDDIRALAELRHRIRAFLAFSEAEARAAGVEPRQHQLLLAVKGLPEGERATIGTIAARLMLKHHSVVELADRLVARGLLQKVAGDVDRRTILLRITPRGDRLLQKLSSAHQAELRAEGPALLSALEHIVRPKKSRASTGVRP
jgi:DNA-binding MarR family transcriptional regulator